MASINGGRVVLGALVGGVVANVLDFGIYNTVLKDDMVAMAQRFGTDPAAMNSLGGALPWIAVDFILALLVVFAYAAMRPRLGPGPKTAIIAGLTLLFAAQALLYGFTSAGMMTMGAYWRGFGASLVVTIIGSLAGCAVYKEA